MTQSNLQIGARVKVTTHRGGAFYSSSYDKEGVVTKLTDVAVHVKFDDGSEDYGRIYAVTVIRPASKIVVGSRIRVTARHGGTFFARHEGKEGTVTKVNGDIITATFDHNGESDYGMIHNLVLVEPAKDAQGFISNLGNEDGKLPAPRGTKMDILYNDGTLILDLPIGDRTRKTAENFPQRSYSATTWRFNGTGGATIKAYRFPADRPQATRRVDHPEMVEGMKVKLLNDGDDHFHWGFKKGQVYNCGKGGPISPNGQMSVRNWAGWEWEVVEVKAETLDQQLAALKAQLDSIEREAATAEGELKAAQERVATKQAVVDEIETRRVVLVGSLTKHGIQFIGETVKAKTADVAFDDDELKVGVTLLCVTPEDDTEHTAGRQYKIIQRDEGNDREFKLESNDGYGFWIENDSLTGYTVVTA